MNRRQKALLIESVLVLAATLIAVVGMIHMKDYVNRSEAIRAMSQLSRHILEYRTQHGSLPPESFVQNLREDLEGGVRMGTITYRALYIGLNASPDTIVAYSEKRFPSSFLHDGYVVLRLDGTVEWMPTALFAAQRTQDERGLPEQ